jgi:DNA-binding NarL/FixJ family response regulator
MRDHGYARYRLDGCRCYTCGWARSQYDDRRTRMMIAGTWQPFTDLATVQEQVAALKAIGLGDRQIATLAQVERKTVRDIAAGVRHGRNSRPMTKVRTETATKILAIPLDPLAASDGTYISATSTWERIDALIEAGWSKARISAEIGQGGRALQLSRHRVTAANARAVKALFDRVLGDSALEHLEVDEDEVIDEVAIERFIGGDASITLTRDEKREAVMVLVRRGHTNSEIARIMHMSGSTVSSITNPKEQAA